MTDEDKIAILTKKIIEMKTEYLTQSSSSFSQSKEKQAQAKVIIQQVLGDLAEPFDVVDKVNNKPEFFSEETPIPPQRTENIMAVEQHAFRQAADVIVNLLIRYKI